MWKFVFAGLIIISLAFFFVSGDSTPTDLGNSTPQEAERADASNVSPVPVVCVQGVDCGNDGVSDFLCVNGFIVQDYYTFSCVGAGSWNATCLNMTRREAIDWCRPDEVCVPGESICQPKPPQSNTSNSANKCASKDNPCPSCSDGIMDSGETAVDCGGPCHPCMIECSSNDSCGIPRWGIPYCGMDGSVNQDYVTYECKNPGGYDSFCKQHRIRRRSDYCGPINRCYRGRCVDDQDREPFAYSDGGYFGTNRTRLSQEYACLEGDTCYFLSTAYETCRGPSCSTVKPLDGEDRGPSGLK